MKKNRDQSPDAAKLRRQAEAKLSERKKKAAPPPATESDTRHLVHELEVDQIELEMQNEELLQSRAQVEAGLRQYTDLYDFAPMGYFTLARGGAIHQVNLAGANLLGVERGKLLKRRFGVFVSAQSRTTFNTFLEKVFGSQQKETCEVTLLKDGADPLWVHIEATSKEGQECRAVVVDITERKRSENALRESFERFQLANRATFNAIWDWNLQTDALWWNENFQALFGYQPEEIEPGIESWTSRIHPQDVERVKTGIHVAIDSGRQAWFDHYLFRCKDGKYAEIEDRGYISRDASGKPVRMIGAMQDITERKRAEEELRTSEERYRSLVQTAPGVIYSIDEDGAIQSLNPEFERITGWSCSEWIGKGFSALVHPDDLPLAKETFQQTLRGETPPAYELRVLCKSGNYVVGEFTSRPLLRDGKVVGEFGIVRDITERKQAEEALKNSEARFRSIWESSVDGMRITDKEGTIVAVNDAYCQLVDATKEELEGRPFNKVYKSSEEEHQAATQRYKERFIERAIAAKMEATLELKSRGVVSVELSNAFLDSVSGQPSLLSIFRDISERKRAEETLRQTEENFRRSLDDSPLGVRIVTAEGETIYANRAILDIYGYYNLEELKRTPLKERYTPESYAEFEIRKEIRRQGELGPSEYRICIVNKNGDVRHLHVFRKEVLWNGKKRFQVIYQDITERKRAEEEKKTLEAQLQQAQKLESLGTLASGIAHDVNNILCIILGYSTLLERRKEDPQKLSQSIEAITKAAQRGAALVTQLLIFARKHEALFESVSVNDMIKEINTLLQETFSKTIIISTSLQQDLPTIVADANQIHQVLLNLCVNARDAMPNRGTLSISTRTIEGGAVSSRFARATARQYVQIEVADTGIGMDESTRQRIFEPFFTTKGPGKGTGLGLAVVFGVVEHHSGFIDVRSAPGEGTSFTVYLPIPERAPEVSQRARKGVEEITGGTETILVIEDEEMLRDLAKAILVSKGYTVLTAEDGIQGVEMYRSHQDQIALVLSDLGLPILSGQDVFRRIREINPQAKVILASGFVDSETKSEMYKAGLEHFIQKPYSPDEVLLKVREVIDTNG